LKSVALEGRKLKPRQAVLGLALLLSAASLLYLQLRSPAPTKGAGPRQPGRSTAAGEIPRIDLARLASPPPASKAGRRDLFEFGAAEPDEEEQAADNEPVVEIPTPPPVTTAIPQNTPPPGRALVAINLKFIGTLEAQGGMKVALLLTDRNEILYGQVGQQVANRFKILKIGYESVEVLDEGSGQSRRIPLKGN
jgi:hypothetical protein